MKKLIIILLFLTLIPFVSGALVQDFIDDSGNLNEIITFNSSIKKISLPNNAINVEITGTNYTQNKSNLELGLCNNVCTISFTIKDIVKKESQGKSFSRNMNAFEPLRYEIHIPTGSIIEMAEGNVVPEAKTITSDGTNIILVWDVNHTNTQRYYVKYTDHEKNELIINEVKNELTEWPVWVLLAIVIILGIILGYKLRKDKQVSVVLEQLLSPDEKILLEKINEHYKTDSKAINQKELGKRLNWSKSKVSGVMAFLVQKKLVEKEKIGRNYAVKPLTKIKKEEKS